MFVSDHIFKYYRRLGRLEKLATTCSKVLGVDENELVNRAVLLFLKNVREQTDLQEEINAWNAASDEALIKMDIGQVEADKNETSGSEYARTLRVIMQKNLGNRST